MSRPWSSGPGILAAQVAEDKRFELLRDLRPNTLSKSVGVRPRQVIVVCDLELRPGPILCGRS